MNEEAINRYILDTFPNITSATNLGDTFYFYDPQQKFTFATLVTGDNYDNFSNLSRPGAYRLNIGSGKETFRKLFGRGPAPAEDSGYDFTVLDKIIPHPVYGRMYWVSVLNPSDTTFEEQVRPLLAEAYEISVRRYGTKAKVEAQSK